MLPRTAVAAGTTFQIVPSLIIVAPFERSSISSVAGSASRGMPEVVRIVTVPPTAGSIVYDSPRMSVRMLRMTSRSSAPSKLSVTDGPLATAPGAAAGSAPPGCCPLTSTPVPLNTLVVSVPSGNGPCTPVVESAALAMLFSGAEGRVAASVPRSGR